MRTPEVAQLPTLIPSAEVAQHAASFALMAYVADERYQVVDIFRSQSNAKVYRAFDNDNLADVALKTFDEPDEYTARRVNREIAAHQLLDGTPGIVGFHDTGVLTTPEGNQRRYLATKFATGGTLEKHLSEMKTDPAKAMEVAATILPAIAAIHEVGLTHCDIKPSNIVKDEKADMWRITDFGIVESNSLDKIHAANNFLGSLAIWQQPSAPPDRFCGTVGYVAPELLDGSSARPQADMYSFGVTTFQAVTGRLPYTFKEGDLIEYAHAVVRESPLTAHELNHAVPKDFSDLIAHCHDPHPENRPTELEALSTITAL